MIKWHRLFGITLTDFFTGTAYNVELEKDLSLKQQLLDVLIIKKSREGLLNEIPDGLENLRKYNLMTYKSHQQALNAWALDEFTGHFVNYRKMLSPLNEKLRPFEDFRLYGVSARYPENLEKYADLKPVNTGVYDISWGGSIIRIIVLSRISKKKKNAIWNLFSAVPETVEFGFSEYEWRTQVSSVINEMLTRYKTEGVIAMTYTVEDFQREYVLEHVGKLSADERLKGISADERLKGISANERLKGISANERLKGISANERLKGISANERLKGIPVDDVLKKISADKRLTGVTSNELSELIKKRFSKKEQKEILEMLKEL